MGRWADIAGGEETSGAGGRAATAATAAADRSNSSNGSSNGSTSVSMCARALFSAPCVAPLCARVPA